MAKKKATKTAVAVREAPSTNLALPASWRETLAKAAKDTSASETPTSTSISFRSGVMQVGGVPVPDNTMECLVVETAYERALYEGKFDPKNIKSPICFALSLDGEDLAPHENSAHPQNETCKGCPMNEWDTAGEGRRGKACKELRRLAIIPADKIESKDDILGAEVAMAKVPITSVPNWAGYVNKVSAMYSVPYWAVFTEMSVQPHIKNQFEVSFDITDTIEDIPVLEALQTKRDLIAPFVLQPYSPSSEEDDKEEEKPAAPARRPKKRKF